MNLSTEQQILIEQRVANEAKSTGLAYVLWFFLGSLGVHRFYLGSTGIGACILFLIWGGLFLVVVVQFMPGLFVSALGGLIVLFDVFQIPGLVADDKSRLREEMTHRAKLSSGSGMLM